GVIGIACVVTLVILAARRTGSSSGAGAGGSDRPVVICTKDFTEQVILGEIVAQELEARGARVVRQFELGGNLCHDALVAGTVDGYPEYTGTAYTAILHHAIADAARAGDVAAAVRE